MKDLDERFTYRQITPYTVVRLTDEDIRTIRRIRRLYLIRLLCWGAALLAFGYWMGTIAWRLQ